MDHNFILFFDFKICCYSNENQVLENLKIKNILRKIILIIFNFFIKFKIDYLLCISKQIKKNYEYLGYKKENNFIPLDLMKKYLI